MCYERDVAAGTAYFARSGVSYRDCESCGCLFVSPARGRAATTCGTVCSNLRKARLQRERYAADPARHVARSREVRRDPESAKRARETRREWRQRVGYSDSIRAADQRRRARKRAVPNESIVARDVFERDRWTCGICGEAVDGALAYPHPLSPSLDHVMPLSKGGPHVAENVRCAHLSCNVRRGARLETAVF